MTIEELPRSNRIDWLDYARAICALSVVFYHFFSRIISKGILPPDPTIEPFARILEYGYLGVDFFFMVSGFVIMMSVGDRKASQFAASRVVRLYPAFVFCMSVSAIVLFLARNPVIPVTLEMWAINLTMIPNLLGAQAVDGVYWTLTYEIVFYAAVFVLIFAGLSRHLERIVYFWIAAQAVAALFPALPNRIPEFFNLLGGYYTLFAGGCLLYFVMTRGLSASRVAALLMSAVLSIAAAIHRVDTKAATESLQVNPAIVGTVIGTFYLTFLVMNRWGPALPAARRVGSLTYPLYLIHQAVGYVMIVAAIGWIGRIPAILLTIVVMVLFALAVSVFVEEKPRRLWKRLGEMLTAPVAMVERTLARPASAAAN